MEPIDWNRLATARRQLTGAPDDALMQARYDAWARRLVRKDRLAEAALDKELLDLLEQIQHAL